jgi:hypothetical protein
MLEEFSAPPARRVFALASSAALLGFMSSAGAQQMPGGRQPGGAGERARPPRQDVPRCPEAESRADVRGISPEQIARHFDDLRSALGLSGAAAGAFEVYTQNATKYLRDEERLRVAPRTVSLSGSTQIDRLYDDARNKFTALEDLQDSAKRMMALLSDEQRRIADPRLLPRP